MVWLLFIALLVLALLYAVIVNAEDGIESSAYHSLHTNAGDLSE